MMAASEEEGPALTTREYPIADAMRAEVLKDYVPEGEFSAAQLTLKRGDIVWVLERDESGWWGGHKEWDDITGWFPKALVRPVGGTDAEDGLGSDGRERCSPLVSPRTGDYALRTRDNRVVASPQICGTGRRRLTIQSGPDLQQEQSALGELQEMSRRLEAAEKELLAERGRRAAEPAEVAAKAQAEVTLLRQHLAERERELDQERLHWDKRVRELEADRQALEQQVRKLQESMARREGELGQQKSQLRAMELAKERAEAAVGATLERAASSRSEDGSCHGGAGKEEMASLSSSGVRGASIGVSRRLFPHAATAPIEGSRTPPPGPPPAQVAVPVTTGSVSAPTMPTVAAVPTIPLTSSTSPPQPAGSLSARHNITGPHGVGQPPRPTPRTAATAPPWMQASVPGGAATVGVPSSPRHRPRQFATTAATREDSTKIEVRALVSAFERRSNSQGAPQSHRAADPSPGRQLVYAGTAPTTSTRAAGSSSRAGSREVSLRAIGRGLADQGEPEPPRSASRTPQHATGGGTGVGEEPGAAVNFGLSPMHRQPHVHHMARPGMAAQSSSPSSKAPMSVQDRIRQLNGGRFGR